MSFRVLWEREIELVEEIVIEYMEYGEDAEILAVKIVKALFGKGDRVK